VDLIGIFKREFAFLLVNFILSFVLTCLNNLLFTVKCLLGRNFVYVFLYCTYAGMDVDPVAAEPVPDRVGNAAAAAAAAAQT
jgi:hypothetical protein